jgi:hypothetical protein
MIRSIRVLALGAAVVVAGVLLSPISPVRAGAPAQAAVTSSLDRFVAMETGSGKTVDYIPVNSRGVTNPEQQPGGPVILKFPMISLATGEVIGEIVDEVGGMCPVFDVVTKFKFSDGEIVNHMPVSCAPDAQREGWIIVGNRPDNNSIIKTTGVFEGRTGKIRLSGTNDLRKFPEELYQDDFWVIELDR